MFAHHSFDCSILDGACSLIALTETRDGAVEEMSGFAIDLALSQCEMGNWGIESHVVAVAVDRFLVEIDLGRESRDGVSPAKF